MSSISLSGKGLGVIVLCEQLPCHHWMSFSAWYSITKNLPDATVVLGCKRGDVKMNLFSWVYPCRAKLFYYSGDFPTDCLPEKIHGLFPESCLQAMTIEAPTAAIRGYKENPGPVNIASDEDATFVSYSNGWPGFNMERWINKVESPFLRAKSRFRSADCNVNELKLLELWEQMYTVFSAF